MKLATKLALIIGLITLGCGVATSLLVSSYTLKTLERRMLDDVAVIVATLAPPLGDAVINEDLVTTREILHGILSETRGVDFAYVTDSRGRILAHTFGKELPGGLLDKTGAKPTGDRSRAFVRVSDKGRTYLVGVYPLLEGANLGTVHVGISHTAFDADIRKLNILILSLSLSVAIAGILIAIFAAFHVTRPLAQLTRSICDFGRGTTTFPVMETSGLEIKQLSTAFYGMVESRYAAEDAMRISEARYRTLFEKATDGILYLSTDLKITMVNEAFARMHGYRLEEMREMNLQDMDTPETARLRAERAARLLAGATLKFEVEHYHRDGHVFPLEVTASLVSIGDEKMIHAFHRDITERKRAEEEIAMGYERLTNLLDSIDSLVYVADFNSYEILFINKYGRDTFGDVRGQKCWQAIQKGTSGPCSFCTNNRLVSAAGNPTGMYEWEFQNTITGTWYECRDQAVSWPGKGLVRMEIATDITERKRAEDALKTSETRFRNLINVSPVPLALNDAQRITFLNPAFVQTFGYALEEIPTLAQWWPKAYPDLAYRQWVADSWQAGLAHAKQTGTPFAPMEIAVCCKNGTVKTVLASAAPISNTFEDTHLVVLYDITERKQAEAEIHKLNAELEERVIHRTAQLEATNKELESFSYSISHDLRAPLRGIDGWSQALLEDYGGQLDDQAHTYIKRVRSETQRMGHLIDDILQLSRLTRAEMRPERVDLSGIARTIAARLQEGAPERPVAFTIQPGLRAQGDPRLLEIALTNLLGNAFKFSGKTLQARIEFGKAGAPGQPAFFVRDNGAGFDMAYANKLFGAFQRMHKAAEFSGTGIGLATVQRIIHRHGGRVWAESQVNQGATFYFTLAEK